MSDPLYSDGELMSQRALKFGSRDPFRLESISPLLELGAYEVLWSRPGMSVKKLAKLFRDQPDVLPSALVPHDEATAMAQTVLSQLRERGVEKFGIRIHRA